MSLPLTGLNVSAFTLGGGSFLGVLKMASISADVDQADGGGISDRYEFNIPVKSGQKVDFTVFQDDSGGEAAVNLDISVWSIGGTAYLSSVRGGSLNVTTKTKEGSGIAGAYKFPVAVRTAVEITTDRMVFSTAILDTLITGTESDFAVTVAITFGVTVFSCPMTMKAGKLTVDREEITMENISFSLKGTPIGPSDSTLLGVILLGSGALAITLDTGGSTYATSGGQFGILTRLNTTFSDAAVIEQQGTLEIQGALSRSGA